MTIYAFRGPLVRPSTESAKLEERERDEEEEQGGDGRDGEEAEDHPSDSFAAGGDLSKKLEKAIGGRQVLPVIRASAPGNNVLAIRAFKKPADQR